VQALIVVTDAILYSEKPDLGFGRETSAAGDVSLS
jgi:hypothetical protein